MSAASPAADSPPQHRSKLPLILGLVLALAGGGGGFMAVQMGLLGGDSAHEDDAPITAELPPMQPVAFVAIDPMIVNLPRGAAHEFLRFAAEVEVLPEYQEEVEGLRPRLLDVMNGYLRAVSPTDFEDPMILERLRAQLLRRLQVVAGEGRVRDLLIVEFVLD